MNDNRHRIATTRDRTRLIRRTKEINVRDRKIIREYTAPAQKPLFRKARARKFSAYLPNQSAI